MKAHKIKPNAQKKNKNKSKHFICERKTGSKDDTM